MSSYRIAISPTRRAAARFIASVRRAIQQALVEEYQSRGLTQAEIARLLKVHRSVINREIRGERDLTLGRVGELAHAMGRRASLSLERTQRTGNQYSDEVYSDLSAGTFVQIEGSASDITKAASTNTQQLAFA